MLSPFIYRYNHRISDTIAYQNICENNIFTNYEDNAKIFLKVNLTIYRHAYAIRYNFRKPTRKSFLPFHLTLTFSQAMTAFTLSAKTLSLSLPKGNNPYYPKTPEEHGI